MPKPIRAAGVLLFRRTRDGQIKWLLLKDRKHGRWDPPKGKREGGETPAQTARRECYEETAINVRIRGRTPGFTVRYENLKGMPKVVDYFLIESSSKKVRLSKEHTQARWMTLDDARKHCSSNDMRKLIDAAAKHLPRTKR